MKFAVNSNTKVVVTSLFIMESDGLVSRMLGLDKVLSGWGYAALMCLFLGLSMLYVIKQKSSRELAVFYYPLLAFSLFTFVSFVSGGILFPKPLKEWLPSLYIFTPIFIFYVLYALRVSAKELMFAIVCVSLFVSLLLLVDKFVYLTVLDEYVRRSSFFSLDVRRIVLLKNEVILGFVILASMIITSQKDLMKNKHLIVFAFIVFFVQALVMESRMGFLAMGVSVIVLLYLKGINRRNIVIFTSGVIGLFLIFPIVFSAHIEKLNNMTVDGPSGNISVRFETVEHFYNLFKESYYIGFGMMSPSAKSNNVLMSGGHYNIADAGFYSSLFQFGILGAIIWLYFTYRTLKILRSYYLKTGKTEPYSAAGFAFLLAFTLSPLPISFFTAAWCISMGGVLLYLLWLYQNRLLVLNQNGMESMLSFTSR